MRNSLTLGKILGIPIKVNASWFLIAGLITLSLASGYFPQQFPGWTATGYWLAGLATALLFFGSVLVHELGHSVVALWEKIPVRGITLFIFGGVAQIGREPDRPGSEFRIAIAGPLTSLALALGFSALGQAAGLISAPLAGVAGYLGRINLMLAVFNMIPGFPLDGGRVLRATLWHLKQDLLTATRWASNAGRAVAFLFIASGIFQGLTGNLFDGLWIALIGWFLNSAAQSGYQHVVMKEMLTGVTARELAALPCMEVPADVCVSDLVAGRVMAHGDRCFFVAQDGHLQGMVTLDEIRRVPRSAWTSLTAAQVMTPAQALAWARPDDELWTLLRRMDEGHLNHLPLLLRGRPVGMITREILQRYIRLRGELGL